MLPSVRNHRSVGAETSETGFPPPTDRNLCSPIKGFAPTAPDASRPGADTPHPTPLRCRPPPAVPSCTPAPSSRASGGGGGGGGVCYAVCNPKIRVAKNYQKTEKFFCISKKSSFILHREVRMQKPNGCGIHRHQTTYGEVLMAIFLRQQTAMDIWENVSVPSLSSKKRVMCGKKIGFFQAPKYWNASACEPLQPLCADLTGQQRYAFALPGDRALRSSQRFKKRGSPTSSLPLVHFLS